MFNILIVDDEKYIVMGLERNIDWASIGVGEVYTAVSVANAKEILTERQIDVILSDIEMPGENGLELVEFARNYDKNIKCIFLTAHSKFTYAKEAMQLGCADYILKPYDNNAVLQAVKKALDEIKKEDNIRRSMESYEKYKDIYISGLWQRFVTGSSSYDAESFIERMNASDISIGYDTVFLPILFSVDMWHGEVDAKTEQVLLYGIKNIIEELFEPLADVFVFTDGDANQTAILCGSDKIDEEVVWETCNKIITYANEIIECDISCYINTSVGIAELQQAYVILSENAKNNLSVTNTVIKSISEDNRVNISAYEFNSWEILLKQKKRKELYEKIETLFAGISGENPDYGYLHMYISGFSYVVYRLINEYMPGEAEEIEELLLNTGNIKNLSKLKEWTYKITEAYFNSYDDTKAVSAAVEETKKYIEKHFSEKLMRDDMAKNVYLNADYLSRIFHKEMGMSISDYIIKVRMEYAKESLANTKYSITHISEMCGYYNFSYFTKIFKKFFGVSPAEYRKNL